MCDDSRAEKQYWMRRMAQLRQQMEHEELERERGMAALPKAAAGSIETRPPAAAKGGWRTRGFVAGAIVAMAVLLFSAMSPAATFVYVSNAEDGDIGMYTLQSDGSLRPGQRYKAEKIVMPMAVSPDKRFLVAAVRSKPFSAYTYAIDRATGALTLVGSGPLADSFPYIFHDRSGRFLLGASYGGHLVSVNPVGADGRVGEPMQVIPTARNAHAIITDRTGRYVFVPHLGTDQVFQFLFDQKSGRLASNTRRSSS